ncbi:P-II family nitrogen regulator [Clostridium sp. MD294]|uniref:P-II family nitrogen regulator n=1 Tax=Clostridium sp. MD294 TaxID=97138 RepID=UPI0002CB585D|nr:P-II family nitrogen regulator [Clostridium sp. MD294]NDO45705.1 P-II family nitrogen regulator [Clostridium sp. MD294]USF30642.1 hypothetical protein C820_002085 [Clostridium sp. MD294]
MSLNKKYALVIAIVNHGYSSDAMEAAKKVGATGGTILHGHGVSGREAAKFLGITINEDKEILMIVAREEIKQKIMMNISSEMGMNSPAKGIVFSLPIDDVYGLFSGNIDV